MSSQAVTQNLQQLLSTGSVPAPAGTDDNGQPYWIIDDVRVNWAEMQQELWKLTRQAQSQTASGGGFESMPQMIDINSMENLSHPDQGDWETPASPEQSVERTVETKVEQRESAETQKQTNKQATSQQDDDDDVGPALVGDSAKITSVSMRNPKQMLKYYQSKSSSKPDPTKAESYLTTLFGKILRMLSVNN